MSDEIVDDKPDETPDEALREPGVKALNAEREARKGLERQLAELQAQLQEHENAKLSETERLSKAAQEAAEKAAQNESDAAAARLDLLRYQVAAEKGIPAAFVARLQGTDRESLEADADSLLPSLNVDVNPKPKADPSQGVHGQTGGKSKEDQFSDAIDEFFTR